jgi:hypothetical protein
MNLERLGLFVLAQKVVQVIDPVQTAVLEQVLVPFVVFALEEYQVQVAEFVFLLELHFLHRLYQ